MTIRLMMGKLNIMMNESSNLQDGGLMMSLDGLRTGCILMFQNPRRMTMKYCQPENTKVEMDKNGNATCYTCGWVLSEDWTYCPNCGRFIDWDELTDESD